MITKNEVITMFENACVLDNTFVQRLNAVKHQFQRNIWEVDSVYFGKIRIENSSAKCQITLFPKIGYYKTQNKEVFQLTKQEYQKLKKIYFGKIEYDKDYFDKIDELFKTTSN
jgi:hypothetical protein